MNKQRLFFLYFVFLLPTIVKSQTDISLRGLTSEPTLHFEYRNNNCSQTTIKGGDGRSSLDLSISLKTDPKKLAETGLIRIANGVFPIELKDVKEVFDLSAQINCQYHIFNVKGAVNSYLVNANQNLIFNKEVGGDVSYEDKVEVYSPSATVLELPFEASASLAAVQTFCNTEKSKAVAKASLTVTFGDQTATAKGEILNVGELLVKSDPNDKKVIRVNVPAGKSTFKMVFKGALFAQSIVQGLSTLGVITCGSNAVAIAGNSLTVRNFTGIDGGPLPQGLKIVGLITGIDYLQNTSTCPEFPKAKMTVVNETCGQANGSATIAIDSVDTPTFEWSNGRTGKTATGLKAGSYYVIVRDKNGCFKTFPVQIENKSIIPKVNLPALVPLRKGERVTLSARDSTRQTFTYRWSTGATTPEIVVDTPGKYSVTITNAEKCTFTYTVDVFEKEGYWISDGNITADNGLFFDDGGPAKNYSPDQNRVITICPQTARKYTVLDFTTVGIADCNNRDILRVFDGKSFDCPLSLDLTSPATFTASSSSQGCLTVSFKASAAADKNVGWRAVISMTDSPPAGCAASLTGCSGTFTDSGGENNNYSNNEYKVYTLCPPTPSSTVPKYISLDFRTVSVANGDHLAVYDGVGTACLLNGNLKNPQQFTASEKSGGCLTVVFDSDHTGADKGWSAVLSCSESPTKAPDYCSCENTTTASRNCDEAPVINNLQTFCGTTSLDFAQNLSGNLAAGFCGIIHNNSFFKFIAESASMKLRYRSKGGTHKLCEGIQLAVLQANAPCNYPKVDWKYIKCETLNGLFSEGVFEVAGLTVGQEYFLMIDGSYGSQCSYAFSVESGFAACKLRVGQQEVICHPNGSYSVKIPVSGVSSRKTYRVFEKNNLNNEVKESLFTDDGKTAFVTVGPYLPGRNFNVVISGNSGADTCSLLISGTPKCPPPPCSVSAALKAVCYNGDSLITLSAQFTNAVKPISVVSDLYSDIFLPDSSAQDEIRWRISKTAFTKDTKFYLTDATNCTVDRVVSPPNCESCPTDVVVYPNPAFDKITFSYPCPGFTIAIVDMSGRRFVKKQLQSPGKDVDYSIDVRTLPVGIYHFIIEKDAIRISKKIVKM